MAWVTAQGPLPPPPPEKRAFIRVGQARNGLLWLTLRHRADLARSRQRFAEPARLENSQTPVRTPTGADPAELEA